MATTKKKSPAKKTVAKKSTVTKKVVPVKKTVTKKSASKTKVKSAKTPRYRSFKLSSEREPFNSFKITEQTVYWIIIVALLIFFQLWILKLQVEVTQILDEQRTQLELDS